MSWHSAWDRSINGASNAPRRPRKPSSGADEEPPSCPLLCPSTSSSSRRPERTRSLLRLSSAALASGFVAGLFLGTSIHLSRQAAPGHEGGSESAAAAGGGGGGGGAAATAGLPFIRRPSAFRGRGSPLGGHQQELLSMSEVEGVWSRCNSSLLEVEVQWEAQTRRQRDQAMAACTDKVSATATHEQRSQQARGDEQGAEAEAEGQVAALEAAGASCRRALQSLGQEAGGEQQQGGWGPSQLLGPSTGLEGVALLQDPQAKALFLQGWPHQHHQEEEEDGSSLLLLVGAGAQLQETSQPPAAAGGEASYARVLPEAGPLIGARVGLTEASGCAETAVLGMQGGGRCYLLVNADISHPPGTVLPFSYDQNRQQWVRHPWREASVAAREEEEEEAVVPSEGGAMATHLSQLLAPLLQALPDLERLLLPSLRQLGAQQEAAPYDWDSPLGPQQPPLVRAMAVTRQSLASLANQACFMHQHQQQQEQRGAWWGGPEGVLVVVEDRGVEAAVRAMGFTHVHTHALLARASAAGGVGWLRLVCMWLVVRLGYGVLYTDPDVLLLPPPSAPHHHTPSLEAWLLPGGDDVEAADVWVLHDQLGQPGPQHAPWHLSPRMMLLRPSLRTYHLTKSWLLGYDSALQWADTAAAMTQVLDDLVARNALKVRLLRPPHFLPLHHHQHHQHRPAEARVVLLPPEQPPEEEEQGWWLLLKPSSEEEAEAVCSGGAGPQAMASQWTAKRCCCRTDNPLAAAAVTAQQ